MDNVYLCTVPQAGACPEGFPDLYVGRTTIAEAWRQEQPHAHSDFVLEFVDTGVIWLAEPRGADLPVGQGQLALFVPGQEHAQHTDGPARTVFVGFSSRQLADVARDAAPSSFEAGLSPMVRAPAAGLGVALSALALELAAPGAGSRLLIDSLCIQVIIHMLRAQQSDLEPHGAGPRMPLSPEIRRSVDFIHSHLETDITLEQLAATAALSRYHFIRMFKRQLGLPPHAYLRKTRLHRAAVLLRETKLGITQIAARLGYANPGHLSTAFRTHYGISPSQFRSKDKRTLV
jgi:AraC family transcriptional regulator